MGIARPVCAANNRPTGDPARCIALPRSRHRGPAGFALRQIAFVPNAGTLTLAGKSVPYRGRGTRSDVGIAPYEDGTSDARPYGGCVRAGKCVPWRTGVCRYGIFPAPVLRETVTVLKSIENSLSSSHNTEMVKFLPLCPISS